MSRVPSSAPGANRDWGELLLGAAVAIFGLAVVWQTFQIRITPAYSLVGPRVVPLIVGIGLVLVGLWLAGEAATGRTASPTTEAEDADPTLPADWRAVGLLTAALILYLVLIEPAGFIIASAVLFVSAAFAMGSRRLVRNLAVGVVMAAVLYLAFTAGLGLRLPTGLLGELF